MVLLLKLREFLKKKILSPYLVFSFFYIKILLQDLKFDWYEIIYIYVALCLFILTILLFFKKFKKFNSYKTSYFISFLFFLTFFLFDCIKIIKSLFPSYFHNLLLILFSLLSIYLFRFIIKTKSNLLNLNYYLNTTFIFFTFIEFGKYLVIYQNFKKIAPEEEIYTKNIKISPNIYFLIIDGYANNKSLLNYWNFDNTPFTKKLENLGFKVIYNSKSNYKFTLETLGSMLNFNYLNTTISKHEPLLIQKIIDNRFTSLHVKNGYKLINLSFCDIENCYFSYDHSFYPFKESKGILGIMHTKIFSPINRKLNKLKNSFKKKSEGIINIDRNYRDNIIYPKLNEIINWKISKKLVIFHYMGLHPPYSNQNLKNSAIDSFLIKNKKSANTLKNKNLNKLLMDTYLLELKRSTKQIEISIENIKKNDKNSIIILMSDHGFRLLPGFSRKISNDESYMNFEAVYFPNKIYNSIHEKIGPINLLRKVTNYSLGTNLELIEEKQVETQLW